MSLSLNFGRQVFSGVGNVYYLPKGVRFFSNQDGTVSYYVGNLPFTATNQEVEEHLTKFAPIQSWKLVINRETGAHRGFGFVSVLPEDAEAIQRASGSELAGRTLRINLAAEKPDSLRRPFPPRRRPDEE